MVITELSSRYPQEGGIYVWTKKAFGDFHGFLCGWCYWLNNLFYFPSLLIFTITCGARRTTVASIRARIAAAR